MYVDPMTIYREYVQNAADSIDEARMHGLVPFGKGSFCISLSRGTSRIRGPAEKSLISPEYCGDCPMQGPEGRVTSSPSVW